MYCIIYCITGIKFEKPHSIWLFLGNPENLDVAFEIIRKILTYI